MSHMGRTLAGSIAVAAMCLATGCATTTDLEDVSYKAISRNPTPELMTVTERPIDVDRTMRTNFNQDLRAMWTDLGRVFMTDQPSRLSPFRTIATSGQPH